MRNDICGEAGGCFEAGIVNWFRFVGTIFQPTQTFALLANFRFQSAIGLLILADLPEQLERAVEPLRTAQKRAQRELREAAERLRIIVRNVPVVLRLLPYETTAGTLANHVTT